MSILHEYIELFSDTQWLCPFYRWKIETNVLTHIFLDGGDVDGGRLDNTDSPAGGSGVAGK